MQTSKRVFTHRSDLRQVPFCPVYSNARGMNAVRRQAAFQQGSGLIDAIRMFALSLFG